MKRHDGPATWESKVRGLLLGLALGDAIGSKASEIPREGQLDAGVATQLAAWTTEGLLRTATRYGGYVIGNPLSVVQYAYQRWATLRGGVPQTDDWNPYFELDGIEIIGWLAQVPAMKNERGSSPSTMNAVLTGRPTTSAGCQAMLRGLPIAAFIGQRSDRHPNQAEQIERYARSLAVLTHDHELSSASAAFSVRLAAECLTEERAFEPAFRRALDDRIAPPIAERLVAAYNYAKEAPCAPETLERLAPDKTGASALAGGIYVAMSFPDADTVSEALEFAGWAPDGDSVAAVAGALLGALHGFEALPVALTSRLELGWVVDALARDLALQVRENQAGGGWKGDGNEDPLDPWWDTKYPGV